MSIWCPLINHNVTYLDCLDCDEPCSKSRRKDLNISIPKNDVENNEKEEYTDIITDT